jgi:hypothetical protein
MPPLSKTLATVAFAALLAAAPVAAGAAEARSAGHHTSAGHGKVQAHGKAHQHAKHDRLAGPRRGFSHAIGAQLKGVQRLVTQASALTIADAAGLQQALAADLAAVQADLDGVAAAASKAELKTLLHSALGTRQVTRVQFDTVVAADGLGEQATALANSVAALQGQLAEAVTPDETALGSLAAVAAELQTVSAQVPGLVTYALAISPTATRAELSTAIAAIDVALTSIQDALDQAGADFAAVQASI